MYFFKHLEWRRTGFTNLINKGKGETMLKVKRKRKRKDGTKEKKYTNSIARIQQLLASRAWNFTTQPRKKKYKICSISEYYVTINHATHRGLKRNTSRAVSNANKGKKKVTLIDRANHLLQKNILKQKRAWPSKTSFLQWPTFVM